MQKRGYKKGNQIPAILFQLLIIFLLLTVACGKNPGAEGEENKPADETILKVNQAATNTAFLKFRSYQNPDSTWGFTIFMNSRPYLHYSRIPLKNAGTGFELKEEADLIAEFLVNKIRRGELSPKLEKATIDSLKSELKLKLKIKE